MNHFDSQNTWCATRGTHNEYMHFIPIRRFWFKPLLEFLLMHFRDFFPHLYLLEPRCSLRLAKEVFQGIFLLLFEINVFSVFSYRIFSLKYLREFEKEKVSEIAQKVIERPEMTQKFLFMKRNTEQKTLLVFWNP